MASFQNPSETSKAKTEEFYLQLARGHISNHYHRHRIGAVPAMSQNQTGTIWDINDTVYPWSVWDTAGTVSIPTVNAADNGKNLIIEGLGEDYKFQQEHVVISSTSTVTSQQIFTRVNRAFVNDSTNVGAVNIQKSGSTVARILAGRGITLMAVYTIPASRKGYLVHGTATCQAGADATGDMFVRYGGTGPFLVGHSFEVSGTGGQYDYTFGVPLEIPEKTDIDVRAKVRSNNARITAAFDIILIDM